MYYLTNVNGDVIIPPTNLNIVVEEHYRYKYSEGEETYVFHAMTGERVNIKATIRGARVVYRENTMTIKQLIEEGRL